MREMERIRQIAREKKNNAKKSMTQQMKKYEAQIMAFYLFYL